MNKNGKALVVIIVLIVIVLVVIGAYFAFRNTTQTGIELYNNANNVAKDASSSINSLASSMYNSRYERYVGEKQSKRMVMAIYGQLKADLNDEDMKEMAEKIVVEGPSEELLAASKYYSIKLEYDSNGSISKIIVSESESN